MKTRNYNPSMPLIVMCLTGLLMISNAANAQIGHMKQEINYHVMLVGNKGSISNQICSFNRILPNGETANFKIPPDKLLVITEVEWQAQNKIISGGAYNGFTFNFEPGDAAWLEINLSDATVFSSRTIRVQTKGAGIGSSEQLTTGLVIGRERFCGRVQIISHPIPTEDIKGVWAGNFGEGFLILRGYLIKAKKDVSIKKNSQNLED